MRHWLTIAALLVAAVAQGQFSTTLKTVLSGDNPILFEYHVGDSLANATFSRTSIATYRDSAGVLRVTPHNLIARSQELITAPWTNAGGNSTVAVDDSVAPDGTTTADGVVETAATGLHYIYNGPFTLDLSATYTASVYVKASTRTKGRITLASSGIVNGAALSFDITAATVTPSNIGTGAGAIGTIESAGSDWYRISVSVQINGGDTAIYLTLGLRDDAGGISYFGDTSKKLFYWGAQLERNLSASIYRPTVAAARFDSPRDNDYVFDPVIGAYIRSLSLEAQRTNHLLSSQDITSASWILGDGATRTANTTVAPDGTTTADTLTFTANSLSRVNQTTGLSGTGTNTVSVWAKTASGTKTFRLDIVDSGVADNYSPELTATTTWQRFSFTFTTASAATKGFNILNNIGATAGSIIVWQTQFENAGFSSSEIYTLSATTSRAADSLSFPFTHSPQEMTVYMRAGFVGNNEVNAGLFGIGSAAPYFVLQSGGANWILFHTNGGPDVTSSVGLADAGNTIEFRGVLKANGSVRLHKSTNGGAEVSGAESAAHAFAADWFNDTLSLGSWPAGSGVSFVSVRDIIISKREREMAFFRNRINN